MTSATLPPADRRAIEPTDAQLAGLADLEPDRPVVMLNLLRYREVADYSDHPDLAPESPISGEAAYQRYGAAVQEHLARVGGAIEHMAVCLPSFIAPTDEQWDAMALVRYPSPGAFLAMISDSAYLTITGHRTAALADSRLIPTSG